MAGETIDGGGVEPGKTITVHDFIRVTGAPRDGLEYGAAVDADKVAAEGGSLEEVIDSLEITPSSSTTSFSTGDAILSLIHI